MNITVPPHIPDLDLRINTALVITETAYQHLTDTDVKVEITIYTALLTTLDDPAFMDSLASRDLHQMLCDGTARDDDGILGVMLQGLTKMWDYFPSFSANAILAATLRFMNVAKLENAMRDTILSPEALPFVEYRRQMSGIAEAYAAFIWEKAKFPDVKVYMQAIPDACLYVNYTNDIMSFYKEEIQGETVTYIHDRALVTGKTAFDTLREVIDETEAASQRVRQILGESDARDAWDSFAKGYISFHYGDPRYRLREIIGEESLTSQQTV